MTTTEENDLADGIETGIRATPGVTALFRTGTTVSKVLDAGARLLGVRDGDAPLVRVEHAPDGVHVDVAIGVQAESGAVETVDRVHSAIRGIVAERALVLAEARLTVVHVDDAAG